jgi:hypothetical protein
LQTYENQKTPEEEIVMDYQILFNSAFTVLMLLIGWIMKTVFEAITELRVSDKQITAEVSKLQTELPTNYVHKHDFKDFTDAVFKKLDRIEDKLDNKADKNG